MVKRISENYVMTVYPGTANSSITELTQLKDKIKNHNKKYDDNLRVKCVGRLGKNNPKAPKYRRKRFNNVLLKDATRWDIYVYKQ